MASFGETFHQDLYHFANLASVRFQRELVLQCDDLIEASYFLFLGDIIGQMFGSIGARSLGVFEHKSRIKSHFAHEAEGLCMILNGKGTMKGIGKIVGGIGAAVQNIGMLMSSI